MCDELVGRIIDRLTERNERLCVAESCTGGLLSAALTAVPGSSRVFAGGVVAYANAVKAQILGVDWATLDEHGAVSEQTAAEMAKNAQIHFRSDHVIATTGIAGPEGGTDDKPVGTVCFAWISSEGLTTACARFDGDRANVRRQAVRYALDRLAQLVGISP